MYTRHNWRITATPACCLLYFPQYVNFYEKASADGFLRYLLNHPNMSQDILLEMNVIWPLGRRGGAGALVPRNGKPLTSKTRKQHAVWKLLAWLIPSRIGLTTEKSLSVRTIHPPVKEMVAWTLLEIRISVPVLFPLALTGRIRKTKRFHLSQQIFGRLSAPTDLEKNTGEI